MLGALKGMVGVEELSRRGADIESSLLITGESGVGKEVAAQFVHEISKRAEEPFIAVNCAAITNELIESQLFAMRRAPLPVPRRTIANTSSGPVAGSSFSARSAICQC